MSLNKQGFSPVFLTIIHEIYHILGWTDIDIQGHFIDPVTLKTRPQEETYQVKKDVRFPHRIITPKVLEYAREYFNCPTMDGVPVEDNGKIGGGTIYSHWERDMFQNDFMTGHSDVNSVISAFSLKLLEDSGWYEVNYDMAEPFFFGKGVGCKILEGECGLHGSMCSQEGEGGCHYNYDMQSYCMGSELTPRCKFFSTGSRDFVTHDCRYSDNRNKENGNLSDLLKESYGLGSRCFEGHFEVMNYVNSYTARSGNFTHRNMCYKAKCQDNKVIMQIGDKNYECLTSGQKIKFEGLKQGDYVQCPDIKDFCEQENARCEDDCNLNGRCTKTGKCWCYVGFSGPTCANFNEPGFSPSAENQEEESNDSGESNDSDVQDSEDIHVEVDTIPDDSCPKHCSDSGKCVDGVCHCEVGYFGKGCENIDLAVILTAAI